MSMATRCTSCGTIFRVVQDQLKVSEGWVRSESVQAELAATARRGWARHQLWYLFVLESWVRAEEVHEPHATQVDKSSGPETFQEDGYSLGCGA